MYPSRPSSPDSNRPYRTSTPPLIDFFARAEAAQSEPAATRTQREPFTPFGALHRSPATIAPPTAEFLSASAPQVTVNTILQYVRDHSAVEIRFLMNETIRLRLRSGRLDPATFLTALEIVHSADHPTLVGLGVSAQEQEAIKHRLIGFLTHSSTFRPQIRDVYIASNNNPEQLISHLREYLRFTYFH